MTDLHTVWKQPLLHTEHIQEQCAPYHSQANRLKLTGKSVLDSSTLHHLTPWNKVLFENLSVSQLFRTFPHILSNPKTITALPTTLHLSLPCTRYGLFSLLRIQCSVLFWHCTTLCYWFSCVLYCSFFLYCTVCACDVRAAPLTEFSRAFSSAVRQIPGYNSQRRGTARTSQISFKFFDCYACS
jgi:hypothetical protein